MAHTGRTPVRLTRVSPAQQIDNLGSVTLPIFLWWQVGMRVMC